VTSLNDVPLSVLDLVHVTSGTRAAQPLRQTVDLAQRTERLQIATGAVTALRQAAGG
jgi:hypothetical protein